jgi:hypothetical protein
LAYLKNSTTTDEAEAAGPTLAKSKKQKAKSKKQKAKSKNGTELATRIYK